MTHSQDYKIVTPEEFKNIYTNEIFRNEIAHANPHSDKDGRFKYFGTCTHPNENRRQVTPSQIYTAQKLKKQRAEEVLKENRNNLLFVGMGCEFKPEEGFINNHRIRTEFLNTEGKRFFIEVGTARDIKELICMHSIDKDLQNKFDNRVNKYQNRINQENKKTMPDYQKIKSLRESKNKYLEQPYNNYNGIEHANLGPYTYANLLQLVNFTYKCNFKKIVIDNTNLSCDGLICKSPKN